MSVARHGSTARGAPGASAPSTADGSRAQAALRRAREYGRRYGQRAELATLGLIAVGMLASIWAAFVYAPTDAVQGDIYRILYFHVPIAWIAYLAFFIVFVASILYLWRRDERWDWLARAAAEIGTVFTTLVLLTGSIWGRPIWGAWWAWDPRLTTSLILWFIYVGYLLLRANLGRSERSARVGAALGILGFIDVPINYLSVTWWRAIHPPTSYVAQSVPEAGQVGVAILLALATFTLLFGYLLLKVYQLERMQTQAERLRARVEQRDA